MTFQLSPPAIAAGYRLEVHGAIDSTNARALELARAGDAGPLWIVSKNQQSGRGRRGRPWVTPEGNLAATLLVTARCSVGEAATLGFVAGLALSDALAAIAPQRALAIGVDGMDGPEGRQGRRARVELKWPNDVMAGGAKLAGILLESSPAGEGRLSTAIGIGVNVAHHPEGLAYPATSLRAIGIDHEPEEVFLALSDAWLDNAALWAEGRGLGAVRAKWLQRAAGLGSRVAVNIDGAVVRGTFETIDDACRFVIRRDDDMVVRVAAGDVHFGAVATMPASPAE